MDLLPRIINRHVLGIWADEKVKHQHYFIKRTCRKISDLGIFSSTNISLPAGSHVSFSHFVQLLGLNLGLGPGSNVFL